MPYRRIKITSVRQPAESLHPLLLTPNPLPANMMTVVVTRSGQSDAAVVGSHSSIPPALSTYIANNMDDRLSGSHGTTGSFAPLLPIIVGFDHPAKRRT